MDQAAIEELARRYVVCNGLVEDAEEVRDGYGSPLCKIAHELNKAGRVYTRSGQYPSVYSVNMEREEIVFGFSNGRDLDDDGHVGYTFAQLAEDPEARRRAQDADDREREVQRLTETIADAQRRLAELQAGS